MQSLNVPFSYEQSVNEISQKEGAANQTLELELEYQPKNTPRLSPPVTHSQHEVCARRFKEESFR
jgi:hypothetical protein